MKKWLFIAVLLCSVLLPVNVLASESYTVKPGDTMWKIALRYQIGVTEIIEANPQIENPDLIYPKQQLTIPDIDATKRVEHLVIQLTNQERAKHGLSALKPDWELSRVARYKSTDMKNKNYFSHQSPTYGSPFTMMKDFGISYRRAAENIARGQQTPQQVVRAWMNSPGHRKNILGDFSHIGVGYVANGKYWTQMFIKK
ncbi:LysM domain/BON superfamily protein [Paraliobacillus sp. PM-2]|uniref:SafA/ExsA family spore coat assembly protein n=1 Tax=Paraliobacillus sp. PM-2 TaxID=1462524 RepID=UPI00061BF7F6|nr:SafA/ExsA family spore coat assembly protein [Paraliobacillus sp. PM-2]CQR46775.1 LysM domain/BON superfamily protein [Paraliobacillus sp. PM-2]